MLLRGHDETVGFQLSFLLSIPAAVGGGLLAATETGLGGLSVTAGATALVVATVVGYLTIDALMTIVERMAFWGVCVGLGGLAILGGVHVF